MTFGEGQRPAALPVWGSNPQWAQSQAEPEPERHDHKALVCGTGSKTSVLMLLTSYASNSGLGFSGLHGVVVVVVVVVGRLTRGTVCQKAQSLHPSSVEMHHSPSGAPQTGNHHRV